MPEGLYRFGCRYDRGPGFGKREIDDLRVGARDGRDQRCRVLDGRTCEGQASEHEGTSLFGSRLIGNPWPTAGP